MNPRHLLDQAEHLVRRSPRRPKQVDLRRGVSAAYYALFHDLCHICANTLVGTGRRAEATEGWLLVYRAVNHGTARRRCRAAASQAFSREIRNFALAFATLQEQRHRADYDPRNNFTRSEALKYVGMAGRALAATKAADRQERLAFAAHVLFEPR